MELRTLLTAIAVIALPVMSSPTHAVRTFVIDQDDTTPNPSITEALQTLRALNDTTPTFDSSGRTIWVQGGGMYVYDMVNKGWETGVQVGDLFSIDGTVWYKIAEVDSSGQRLTLERPFQGTGWINSAYTIVQDNVFEIAAGSYFENLDFTGIHFLTLHGQGKEETVLHQANDRGDYDPFSTNVCQSVYTDMGDMLKHVPQFGRIEINNLAIHSNGAGPLLDYDQPAGKTDFVIRNVKHDQSFGPDIFYVMNGGHIEITDSEFRGTGDGLTFQNVEQVTMRNVYVHDRYMPCLPMWAPGGLRIDDVRQPSRIENLTLVVDGKAENPEHVLLRVLDSGASENPPQVTLVNSKIAGNVHPSIYGNGRSRIQLENVKVVSQHGGPDVLLLDDSTVTATCSTGLDRVQAVPGAFSSSCP